MDEILAFTQSLRRLSTDSLTSDPASRKASLKIEMGPKLEEEFDNALESRRSLLAEYELELEKDAALRQRVEELSGNVPLDVIDKI